MRELWRIYRQMLVIVLLVGAADPLERDTLKATVPLPMARPVTHPYLSSDALPVPCRSWLKQPSPDDPEFAPYALVCRQPIRLMFPR
jgi:hypothetical protein